MKIWIENFMVEAAKIAQERKYMVLFKILYECFAGTDGKVLKLLQNYSNLQSNLLQAIEK
jgi:hypothetical protein